MKEVEGEWIGYDAWGGMTRMEDLGLRRKEGREEDEGRDLEIKM